MRPRLIACMAWFDESPTWLAATVASLANCCDRIVAVDGCFALWPESQRRACSGPEQAEAIFETAHGAGLACTVDIPREPFYGNEVEKRAHLFRLASLYAEPFRDWLLVIDADEVVTFAAADLREQLGTLTHDIATFDLVAREDRHGTEKRDEAEQTFAMRPGHSPMRGLVRVLDNLRVEDNHYHYLGENESGETVHLWGDDEAQVEAADMTAFLRLDHRRAFRAKTRQTDQAIYYRLRDDLRAERVPEAVLV